MIERAAARAGPLEFSRRVVRTRQGAVILDGRRRILVWWLVSRVLVLASAAAIQIEGFRKWHPSFLAHPFVVLGMWDGRWYRTIAERGYLLIPARGSDPAFFPLYPVIERVAHTVGLPYVLSGVLVANVGFVIGLLALYELGREFLPEPDARRAVVYLAVFPFGFVFSMAYPEGVVLPLVVFAGLFALRGRWFVCAMCAAAATLARPEAILLVLPLAAVAVRGWPKLDTWSRSRAVAAVLAGPAALISFSAYLGWTLNEPLAWSKAEHAWGRSFALTGVYRAVAQLLTAPKDHNQWIYRDVVFCAGYLLMLLVALRARVPRSWILAGAGMVLLPLTSGTFTSEGRFGLLALPVFWGMAVLGRRVWINRVVLALSPVLLAAAVFTIPQRFP